MTLYRVEVKFSMVIDAYDREEAREKIGVEALKHKYAVGDFHSRVVEL